MLAAVIISAALLAANPTASGHLVVADVVKSLSLDEAMFSYEDEPPGKLRAVECTATLRDTSVKIRVRIEVVYTLDLFSDKFAWDIKNVRAATVQKVIIEPQATKK